MHLLVRNDYQTIVSVRFQKYNQLYMTEVG